MVDTDMSRDAPKDGYAPYHMRVAPCGCRSVPDGQHLPGCARSNAKEAPRCSSCGLSGAPLKGTDGTWACPHCQVKFLETPLLTER